MKSQINAIDNNVKHNTYVKKDLTINYFNS